MQSDEDLMLAVREGDLNAFEALVLRYQAEAWRVAYWFVGDAAEAEDLTQEVFLRILGAAHRYRATATFRTYLVRILTRLCLDYRRKKRPISAELPPDATYGGPSPVQQAGQTEQNARVQAALDALPADYRMVMVLRYFEGLSTNETAQVMGRSAKAVERLGARAKAILELRLKGLLAD